MNTSVIGIGKLGLCFALTIEKCGYNVVGVDISQEYVDLVNEKTLSLMKKGSYLINTSRGGLIDELALATALKNNVIGGAALDVLSVEPPPIDHCLMQESIPNLLITPHNAWTSIESRKRLIKGIVENIDSFIKGTPINVVS